MAVPVPSGGGGAKSISRAWQVESLPSGVSAQWNLAKSLVVRLKYGRFMLCAIKRLPSVTLSSSSPSCWVMAYVPVHCPILNLVESGAGLGIAFRLHPRLKEILSGGVSSNDPKVNPVRICADIDRKSTRLNSSN